MSLEPILVFFLIRYLRKSLRTFSPNPEWDRWLSIALYGVVALFVMEIIFGLQPVTMWIWHALLLLIIWITFTQPGFNNTKTVMYAVLPLIILSLISDLTEALQKDIYKKIETYLGLALAIAITWMVAMLMKSNKQQKALEKERKKTQDEEERSKFISAQKDQLEVLVAARTAELSRQKEELQHAITELRETQTQLIQSEKMASLGELTAGIAHEIQNPLNFVNNFSDVNAELLAEMKEEIDKGNIDEAKTIANDVIENEQKINHHGKRADAIVKGMLLHSRTSTGQKELTDINALADEYLRLSYHGLRAKDKSFNATMQISFDETMGKINIIPQDIGRVLLNLFNNAFYAASLPSKGGFKEPLNRHEPTVWVSTKAVKSPSGELGVQIKVRDNGPGIPQNIVDKIFQPFFTTKPTGQGTGLGLSLSYDIIKAHGGEIKAETKEGEFTEFDIYLPVE